MKFTLDIILPNYNKEEYLEETINSITDQTFNDWKLIIIDNCSTDNSKKIINKYNSQKKYILIFLKKIWEFLFLEILE